MAPKTSNRLATLLDLEGYNPEPTDEMREALALVLLSMAVEDGELADEETAVVTHVLADNPLFDGDRAEIDRCLKLSLQRIMSDAFDEHLLGSLDRFVDEAERTIVAAMVLAVERADLVQSPFESEYCELLMERLDIAPDDVSRIADTAVRPFLEELGNDG